MAAALVPLLLLSLFVPAQGRAFQQLSLERLWEVGAAEGPQEVTWNRISDAVLFGDVVYGSDIALPAVRRFTMDGEFLEEIGGAGQGPGEFLRPASMTVVDGALRVYDIGQGREVILDEAGRHLRTSRPGGSGGAIPYLHRVWAGRHEWFIGETALVGRRLPDQSESAHHILAWQGEGPPDTVATIEGNAFWTRRTGLNRPNMITTYTLGADGGAWVLGDSLLAVVDGSRSDIRLYRITQSGLELTRGRSLPGAARPVTDEDEELVEEWYYWRVGMAPSESTIEEFILPEQWSAWTRVRGDDSGRIWIRRGGPSHIRPGTGETWVRWGLDQDRLTELELPPRVEALQFGGGNVVAVRKDDLGIESLVLYRILEGGG